MLREQFVMVCDFDLCRKVFNTYTDVKTHYRSVHKIRGYLTCCNKKFTKLFLALDHCALHRDPNAFKLVLKICFLTLCITL